jgi:hypothetical protein
VSSKDTEGLQHDWKLEQIFCRKGRRFEVYQMRDGLWGWHSQRGKDVMSIAIPMSVITGQPMAFKSKRGAVRHAYDTAFGLHGHSKRHDVWDGPFEPILKGHRGAMVCE